jgi:hypothetical protein
MIYPTKFIEVNSTVNLTRVREDPDEIEAGGFVIKVKI